MHLRDRPIQGRTANPTHAMSQFPGPATWPCRGSSRGRIKCGEWLIALTNSAVPRRALQTYKRRWGIECLFAEAKTRGFNLADTCLTDPGKIATPTAVLALAITWVHATASCIMGLKAIRRKAAAQMTVYSGRCQLVAVILRMKSWIGYVAF